jgi:hypothetical protein
MSSAPRLLLENACYRVEVVDHDRLFLVTRSSVPFTSAFHVDAMCSPVQRAMDDLGRAGRFVLVDSRAAPANNDPVYESWFDHHRKRMIEDFVRAAVVVRSIVGALHARRLADRHRNDAVVFTSMDEARVWLTEGTQSTSTSTFPPRRR